jgi:hypothetical protein
MIMTEHTVEARQDAASIAFWPRCAWGASQISWSLDAPCRQQLKMR